MATTVILSCEHGGNRIPKAYAPLFASHAALLESHRGYDAGALQVARAMARVTGAPLFASTVSRLLVDLNRSQGHPALFSRITRELGKADRLRILHAYYVPHRGAVEESVASAIRRRVAVLHLCVHSFTPELDGVVRNADIGLLFDPRRPGEAAFCRRWREVCQELAPELRVRFNYPYRGTSDGFTTYLRRRWSPQLYVGVELEINQALVTADPRRWAKVRRTLVDIFVRAAGRRRRG
ncbi:MAG TPA: N-formylglutamate amidohydrolase [Myxococcota bacterium]|nr:N-formylglutamate amidohydrolase [Myxococcota bacterium]